MEIYLLFSTRFYSLVGNLAQTQLLFLNMPFCPSLYTEWRKSPFDTKRLGVDKECHCPDLNRLLLDYKPTAWPIALDIITIKSKKKNRLAGHVEIKRRVDVHKRSLWEI